MVGKSDKIMVLQKCKRGKVQQTFSRTNRNQQANDY
jgi:hypothetical protein